MRAKNLLLLLAVILFACKKDVADQPLGPPVGPDGPGPAQELVAGDTTDMIVMNHDLTVEAGYAGGTDYLNVDLDGDPGHDITFIARSIMPSLTTSPGAYLYFKRMNPALKFIGQNTADTILRAVDSILVYQPILYLHVVAEVGCNIAGSTSVDEIHYGIFRPYVYEASAQIDTLAGLSVDSVLLSHGARTYNSPFSFYNDSTAIKYTTYYRNNNCFGVPQEEIFYIGFILDGPNGPRHGFLCLEQLSALSLKLHYSAIEP